MTRPYDKKSSDAEMDKFEAWFVSYRPDWSRNDILRIPYHKEMGYASSYMQAVWKGWQARSKLKELA
ncbi:hypothetical protein BTJ39_23995 [Izhakiella australiensis]|uniref:Uncharacterized protein n=1 Tax=Izhakiella australiensis TaxID=1926881 RepID=A0A1S8Y387_9GAMM|nr:hypothetical protein BTJ39_23995 [Izhakiella australiensis]